MQLTDSAGNVIDVSLENGFKQANALPDLQMFTLTEYYPGTTITNSKNKVNNVLGSYAVILEDWKKNIGYPIDKFAFSGYTVTLEPTTILPGVFYKPDNRFYFVRQFDDVFTTAFVDDVKLQSPPNSYLVVSDKCEVLSLPEFTRRFKFV